MWQRARYPSVAALIFLAATLGISSAARGQERRIAEPRAAEDLARQRAAEELTRHESPEVQLRIKRALGLEPARGETTGAQLLAERLRKQNLVLNSNGRVSLRARTSLPSEQEQLDGAKKFQDRLSFIGKRDAKNAAIGAIVSQRLDPQRGVGEIHSQLERRLRALGVTDYQDISRAFEPGIRVSEGVLEKDTPLYRLYGGQSKASGRWFTCCPEPSKTAPDLVRPGFLPLQKWLDACCLALPHGNTQEQLAEIIVKGGTPVLIGMAAENFMDEHGVPVRGGGFQVFVPLPPQESLQVRSLFRLPSGAIPTTTDLVVVQNDTVAFYRAQHVMKTRVGQAGALAPSSSDTSGCSPEPLSRGGYIGFSSSLTRDASCDWTGAVTTSSRTASVSQKQTFVPAR